MRILHVRRWHISHNLDGSRYKLSLRDIAEMFLEQMFLFMHETVRDWEARFVPLIADQLHTKRHGQAETSGYVDEAYIKVHGKWCYLYRAIDNYRCSCGFLRSSSR